MHSYLQHDSFVFMTRLIRMYDTTYSYVHVCHVTHSCVNLAHDICQCGRERVRIYMCVCECVRARALHVNVYEHVCVCVCAVCCVRVCVCVCAVGV